jgi:large subunit ribosomal protein L24
MKKQTLSHVKLGDTIKVISGFNKGFIGKINAIILKKSIVFIEGIPPRIKYSKSRQAEEAKKISLPIGIHISNVMLWDKEGKYASKIGYKIVGNKKFRYFKKSGNIVV